MINKLKIDKPNSYLFEDKPKLSIEVSKQKIKAFK